MVMFTLAVAAPAFLAGFAIAETITRYRANRAYKVFLGRVRAMNAEEVRRLPA